MGKLIIITKKIYNNNNKQMKGITPDQQKLLSQAAVIIVMVVVCYGLIRLMKSEKSVTGIPSTIGPPTKRINSRKLRNMKDDEEGWD